MNNYWLNGELIKQFTGKYPMWPRAMRIWFFTPRFPQRHFSLTQRFHVVTYNVFKNVFYKTALYVSSLFNCHVIVTKIPLVWIATGLPGPCIGYNEIGIFVRRRLTERVNELIHTESVYVDRLRHVVENYIPEMNREDLPPSLRGMKSDVFANIERIHRFHSEEFLPALRDCENDLRKLGQCFRRFVSSLIFKSN